MTWLNIKSSLALGMSNYTAKRCKLLRRGKYMAGDHYQDGMVAMCYETILESSPIDDFYPMSIIDIRRLIFSFNNLTGETVPDVWTN